MIHLNGDMLCAIDTETTGLDPTQHEIIEIAIIPLGHDLKVNRKVTPFALKLKPDRPETIDYKAMSCNKQELNALMLDGINQRTAADLLEKWFTSLKLGINRRIVPLGHNYTAFDQQMIKEWLGPANYEFIFSHNARDTMQVAHYLNDRTYFLNDKPPFPKTNLGYVASQLNIKNPAPHTALGDAYTVANCYRVMMGKLPVALGEFKCDTV